MTPFFQQPFAEFPPGPKADIIAEDRSCRGCGDDEADVEPMAGAGVYGSTDQDGFSGHRDARALDHHDEKDRAIPVMHKMLDESAIEEIHA
jgi:hypothetical protein